MSETPLSERQAGLVAIVAEGGGLGGLLFGCFGARLGCGEYCGDVR